VEPYIVSHAIGDKSSIEAAELLFLVDQRNVTRFQETPRATECKIIIKPLRLEILNGLENYNCNVVSSRGG
jgi:hypothetical protein